MIELHLHRCVLRHRGSTPLFVGITMILHIILIHKEARRAEFTMPVSQRAAMLQVSK